MAGMAAAIVISMILVAVIATSGISTPKPKATTLDEFSIPTVSKDRLKPKLYGTRWITGPNVCDFGAYSTSPIKQ
jgi:hypothetical protein